MSADRDLRPETLLDLAGAGAEPELTDKHEEMWREVVKRVDEVYTDLLRYEADLESKNAELEEAQSFISSVIASVSDILVVCDAQGTVIQTNPAFVALLGRGAEELLGRTLESLIVEEDRARARRWCSSGGQIGECELRFLTPHGASDMMAVNFSTRLDHGRRRVGAVLTGRPIGELRRAYQALHGAHLELQKAQRKLIEQEKMASLGRLVAGVAHELNNPISFVYGNIHVLDRYRRAFEDYFTEAERQETGCGAQLRKTYRIDAILKDLDPLIEGTLEGAKRISEIVKNLRRLSFARGHEAQDINLARVIALATQWAATAKKNQAKIEIDVPPDLVMRGNEGQVHQIIVNLIDNALDAVRETRNPTIMVGGAMVGGEVEITVADNGIGISESVADKMFEPFFTTKIVGEGTGLGLWISYSIAREHGGSLTAANRESGGAVFVLRLPVSY